MPVPYQLVAAHPVLDFVNTLDNRFVAQGPTELLGSYEDLLSFVRQSALLDPRAVPALGRQARSSGAAQVLRDARELREALAATLYGMLGVARKPTPRVIKTLERHFLDAARHQELLWRRPAAESDSISRATWSWGHFAGRVEMPIWVLALSAAGLLTSDATEHVHLCNSETCRWLFLDLSKNHSRRWCDMKICGNRMKVRRYQARHERS